MVPFRVINLEKLRPDARYRKDHKYYELPAALDIETSRTGTDKKKDFAFIYLWGFAVGEVVAYGRTPAELIDYIHILRGELRLAIDFRLLVYVHFLKYEFQFLKHYLTIEEHDFIARSSHEPLRILCNDCIELRDSYTYTEQPLEIMGREIGLPKVDGFDYDVMRTPETPLTEQELFYQECDVLILTRYFTRESNFYGGISRIPLTATQRVQRVISAELDRYSQQIKWRVYNQQLNPADERERAVLHLLHIAFFGGFNYCNRLHAGETIKQAYGVDIDTSYGAQCLFHRFPRKRFKPLPTMAGGVVPPGMLEDIINGRGHYKDKALLITCEFEGLEARIPEVAFLPIYCKNYLYRSLERKRSMKSKHLTSCEHVETCLTDIDFRLVCKWYKWREIKIHSILGSMYAPLPEYVLQAIIDMIAQKKATKSELQEVEKFRPITEEERAEYTRIKSFVSRIYGLFVKDPLRMDYTYDKNSGSVRPVGIHGAADETDGKKKRFAPVLYQWGVWVASWARHEILSVIEQLAAIGGTDRNGILWNRRILYSDTDSVKWYKIGAEALEVVNAYNLKKQKRLEDFCTRRKISADWLRGLGELEFETYTLLRAVGMKQYAEVKKGRFDYHIAGLPRMDFVKQKDGTTKNRGCTYFDKWENPADKIEHLTDSLTIPAEESHLNATIFIDDERAADVIDRDGKKVHVSARSCILLVAKEYHMQQSFTERLRETDENALLLSAARNYGGII